MNAAAEPAGLEILYDDGTTLLSWPDTVLTVIDKVASTPFEKEIVLVDDCSSDGTRDILQSLNRDDVDLKVFYHEVNQGKGAALRTGFAQTTGDIVIIPEAFF